MTAGHVISDNFDMSMHTRGFSKRKVYGPVTGRTYKTVGTPGNYRRISYRKPSVVYMKPLYKGLSLYQSRPTVEWKQIDTIYADNALPVTDAFSSLAYQNLIAQGVGNSQRVGRKITLRSIYYRFHMGTAAGTSPYTGPVRIVVVYDRQPNGLGGGIVDVFSSNNFHALQNLNNGDRFLVLSDQIYESSSTLSTHGQMYKKLSLDTVYSGAGATIADMTTGSISAFVATPGGAAAVVINLNFRVRYIDC